MKKIFTAIYMLMALSASAMTVNEASGTFKGVLNIGGQIYPDKEVYILPGTESDVITFVLPDFRYNGAPLGNIVLVNIPMAANGRLTLEESTLYLQAISERATISVINGLEDGGVVYNSTISASEAQILLSIAAPSLPEPIFVLFAGQKTNANYAIANGGFEGSWTNGEPDSWHSFPSATGSLASMAGGDNQFQQSDIVRPGSTGAHSVMLASNLIVGVKANGNCTNGQINAGSTTADDANGNYNFSDPSNSGYNTPFVGNPDSLVFWTRYMPADKNPSNAVNKARAHAVITTNARYQDPEASDYSSVKVADAAVNYAATSDMGWQRLSVPFHYTAVNPSSAAYILVTFTTNETPGGGSTYSTGGLFNKKNVLDTVYLDDVEAVYNHGLQSLTIDGDAVTFVNGQAQTEQVYSDSAYTFSAAVDGKAALSFIGYDAATSRVYVYVVADNYSQAHAYSLYTLQMAEPVFVPQTTEYAYEASTCAGEPYSDELFHNLTEGGVYVDTIVNGQGGDSVVTLTLTVYPVYSFAETASMLMNETVAWRGNTYTDMLPGVYYDTVAWKTSAGCDSLYTLTLTVEAIGYLYEEEADACQHEEISWHGQTLNTADAGTFIIYDSLQSVYGKDSVYKLTFTVKPTYLFEEEKRVNEVNMVWRGRTIRDLPVASEPYLFYDSLTTLAGCDSVYMLVLHVSDVPITYGFYEAVICEGERVKYEGVWYTEAFEGDVLAAQKNIYGGDSVVHLVVTVLPSYSIDEFMTIIEGEHVIWEGFDLSTQPAGEMVLEAWYYSEDFCDSVRVLHLTVVPEQSQSGLQDTRSERRVAQKVFYNGRIYIIRKDESIYDVSGNKIQ